LLVDVVVVLFFLLFFFGFGVENSVLVVEFSFAKKLAGNNKPKPKRLVNSSFFMVLLLIY